MLVNGGQVVNDLVWLLPNMREHVNCPHCRNWMADIGSVIVHLNDNELWTREQIADWLDTLDIDLTFPAEAPSRSEPISLLVSDTFIAVDPAPPSNSTSWTASASWTVTDSAVFVKFNDGWVLLDSLSKIQFTALNEIVTNLSNGFKKFASSVLKVYSALESTLSSSTYDKLGADWLSKVPTDAAIDSKKLPKIPVIDTFRFKNGDLPLDLSADAVLAKTKLTVSTIFPDGLSSPVNPKFLAPLSYPKPKEKRNGRQYGP